MLFDTSAILDYLKGGRETREIVESEEEKREPIAISTISVFELLSPIFHRRLSEEERTLRAFFRQTTVLSLDARSSEEAAKIMGALLRIGKPINTLDVLVCGIGLANGVDGIITKDRDFKEAEKVAELNVRLV